MTDPSPAQPSAGEPDVIEQAAEEIVAKFTPGTGLGGSDEDWQIVISDFDSGFWAFHMDGFNGWDGHNW